MSIKRAGAVRVGNNLYIRSDMVIDVIKDFNKNLGPQIMSVVNELCETEDVDVRKMRKTAKSEISAHNDFTKDLVDTFKNLFKAINKEMDEANEEEE